MAAVNTTTSQYDVVKTRFGSFLVSAASAKPYLDGYQIKLQIGNLTSFVFNGAKLNVQWGATLNKTSNFDVTNRLVPGAWNYVYITLDPAKAADVKTILVQITLNEVQAPSV